MSAMADKSKAEKIAAAKKKLKQHQAQKNTTEPAAVNSFSPATYFVGAPQAPETNQCVDSILGYSVPNNNYVNPFDQLNNNNDQKFTATETIGGEQTNDTGSAQANDVKVFNSSSFFTSTTSAQDEFLVIPSQSEQSSEPTEASFPMQPTVDIVSADSDQPDHSPISANIESLSQLSSHMNALISYCPTESVDNQTPATTNVHVADLENRNLELANALGYAVVRQQEQQVKILDQNSTIENQRLELQKLKFDNATKVSLEMGPLQEQLQSHIQTVGILIGEKAELTASLASYQSLARDQSAETARAQDELFQARMQIKSFEEQIQRSHQTVESTKENETHLRTAHETLQREMDSFRLKNDDLTEQLSELKQKVLLQNEEQSVKRLEIGRYQSEIEMLKLRIEQLSSGTSDQLASDTKLETMTQQLLAYEQQGAELTQAVNQLTGERDEASRQYQMYVQQLNCEQSALAKSVEQLSADNAKYKAREENLVAHISALEKQIQSQISKQRAYASNSVSAEINSDEMKSIKEAMTAVTKNRDELIVEVSNQKLMNQKMDAAVQEKNNEIVNLLERLEQIRSEQPITSNLLASIESDKVAASRAVAQNQELKFQLDEMQKAFIAISNDKLELTEQLQREQFIGKDIGVRFASIEQEVATLRGKIHFKDEEMMRLAHENTELTGKLNEQLSSVTQQMSAAATSEATQQICQLEEQLQESHRRIFMLKSQLKRMESVSETNEQELLATRDHDHEHDHDHESNDERSINVSDIDPNEMYDDRSADIMSTSTFMIATHEAMEKLQDRFKRTMTEMADLTEEKQRLEHLVMQLQSETETIGEYVALYQTQRKILKQRESEKELQMQKLATDREEMKEKLFRLNTLVEDLLNQKNIQPQIDGDTVDTAAATVEQATVKSDARPVVTPVVNGVHDRGPMQTAEQILSLLSEIKTNNEHYSNLVDPNVALTVRHCPCCSGKLETV